jgi:hypothetical protein
MILEYQVRRPWKSDSAAIRDKRCTMPLRYAAALCITQWWTIRQATDRWSVP